MIIKDDEFSRATEANSRPAPRSGPRWEDPNWNPERDGIGFDVTMVEVSPDDMDRAVPPNGARWNSPNADHGTPVDIPDWVPGDDPGPSV